MLVATTTSHVRGADVEKGKALFEQCAACHSLDGTGDYDGPTLKGVIGRKAGSLEDYRYSAAMKRSDVVWDAETLVEEPYDMKKVVQGMALAGEATRVKIKDAVIALVGGPGKKVRLDATAVVITGER